MLSYVYFQLFMFHESFSICFELVCKSFLGKVVLDELGIITNGYFASEIDLDALIVTRVNHGSSITEIGDITQLTESKVS